MTRRDFLVRAAFLPAACAAATNEGLVRVQSLSNDGIQPQLVLCDRILHLVYFAGDARHGDLYYVRSKDFGRSFSAPLRVNSQSGSAIALGAIRGAQIAVSGNRVHVVWNGSDVAEPRGPINPELQKPGSPMLYSRLNEKGNAFEVQRSLMTETFGLDGGGSVAAGKRGNVYVAWHGKVPGAPKGEAGRRVWMARSTDDGRTFSAERPIAGQSGVCGCCALRLLVDSNEVLYGMYRSATENVHRDIYLLVSRDRAETFSLGKLHPWELNACPMSSMAFLQAGKDVIGAWETQSQIYFAPVNHGIDAAQRAAIPPPGLDPQRKYPALARNGRGETLLAWVEGARWQHGGQLGWRVFDAAGKPTLACGTRRDVPVWSFPAATANPDHSFTILV